MYKFNAEKVKNDLILWIKNWFEENGKGCNAVIGISGGKDSTIVAALCVEALGKDRVIGVMMPNGEQKDISDSIAVCEFLGIKNYTINIKDSVDAVLNQMKQNGVEITEQTMTNLPARIRMSALYAVSQSNNGRVSNNCNKSEDVMGYSTRWGDGVGDFSPLSHLTTVEIVQIGDLLGLPHELVHKTPIDGLKTNTDGSYMTDEQSMGVTYEEIHLFVRDRDKLPNDIYDKIREQERKNMFKLQPIPFFRPKMDDIYLPYVKAPMPHTKTEESVFLDLLEKYKKYGTLYIGVDFDNTLKPYDSVSERYERGLVDLLKEAKAVGMTLCLWTLPTSDENLKEKIEWCDKKGIRMSYINESPLLKEYTEKYGKPHFNLLLDDTAGLESAMRILANLVLTIKEQKRKCVGI